MDLASLVNYSSDPRYALVVVDMVSNVGDALLVFKAGSTTVYDALVIPFGKVDMPVYCSSGDGGAFKSNVNEFVC